MSAIESVGRLKSISFVALLAATCAVGAPAQDDFKPQAKAKRPDIYNAKLDTPDQLKAACARAQRDNKRILVMFGGNWCGWCHKLHELFASNQEIRKTLL